jgi:hypothetical protein
LVIGAHLSQTKAGEDEIYENMPKNVRVPLFPSATCIGLEGQVFSVLIALSSTGFQVGNLIDALPAVSRASSAAEIFVGCN